MNALPIVVAVLMLVAPAAGGVAPADAGLDDTQWDDDGTSIGDAPSTTDVRSPGDVASLDTGIAPAQTEENGQTFRILSTPPDAQPRTNRHAHDADLGTALEWDVDEVDAALETEAIVRHIESSETAEERQRRILAAVNEVEQDEVSLNSRQRAAIDGHAAGELSDRELLNELATISAIAREYDERLDVLDDLAAETEDFSSPTRLDELQVQLQVYEGPVRDHALATTRGETGGSNVHVESSEGAVVLATIDGEEYVREAFRTDRWDRAGGTIGSEDAINVTAASYPETTALREPDAFGAGAIQRITVAHEFGELRTFVSGGTDQVFVEHQRIALDAFPDFDSQSASADGFNVTVDRTYRGGPIKTTVLDEEDGTPVDDVTVTMSVDGGDSEAIGTTNDEGAVWTLSPPESYRITVVDEPRVAVVDGVTPIDTPRIVDESPDDGDGSESDTQESDEDDGGSDDDGSDGDDTDTT